MAEISLSLNVLDASGIVVQIPDRQPLRETLPGLLADVGVRDIIGGVLDQCLVLLSRPVASLESTLYELGVRTGDVLSILPRPRAPTSGILFNVLSDSGDAVEVSDQVPLAEILPPLLSGLRHADPTPEQVTVAFGRAVIDLDSAPQQLGVRPGDILSLMQVRSQASRVTLVLASPRNVHSPFRVNYSPAVLGRFERALADQPLDIDLSRVLPRRKEHIVSRWQAEFIEENDVWSVHLHPEASAPMFVDNQRLLLGQPLVLSENNVLSFGASPNRPDFQLVVRFETD